MRMQAMSAAIVLAVGAGTTAWAEDRQIDGTGNNLTNNDWGSAGSMLMREASGAHYSDGVSTLGGATRPSARAVSNGVAAQSGSVLNSRGLSDWVWQWGQFLDHDLDLSDEADPHEAANVAVPMGDPHFDPMNSGTQIIPLNRSAYAAGTGTGVGNPRQQTNSITAWIDASNIYGSDATRANALRAATGGKLEMSAGNLIMFNTPGLPNAGGTGSNLFLSGDVRANEQAGLTSVHVLFAREHNRLVDELSLANPLLTDDELYEKARKIVGAQMQVITYNEFLPALLGGNAPSSTSSGYNDTIDPSISNAFSTAAYRIGHTMLSGTVLRLDDAGNEIANGHLSLRDAFFNPQVIIDDGIEPILKGLASQQMQEIDNLLVDDVRNFLFGPPGSGGLDLASLNIQRGRDHGLADYNTMRQDFGLAPVATFADITSNISIQNALASLYTDVNDIDAWVGGLAEDALAGSSVGELFTAVMVDQFTRVRDGDRFWYQFDDGLTAVEKSQIAGTRLSDIILRNTSLTNIQNNVFFIPEPGALALMFGGALTLLRRRRA